MSAALFRRLLFLLGLVVSLSLPVAVQGQPCSGFASQLKIGNQARVTPGSANNVRQNPGTSQTKIGQIPGNRLVKVIGGPSCADNVTWWQVNFDGLIGWTGEGTGAQHWMDTNVAAASQPNTPLNGLQGTAATTTFVASPCFLMDGQPTGRASINGDAEPVGNGASVSYSISDDGYDDAPDVCVPDELAGTARAVSPFGEAITPLVNPSFIGIHQVSLPLWAYSVPGRWELGVQGFSLFIDVQPAARPTLEEFSGQLLLGGFQPEERIVIVHGVSSRLTNSEGVPIPFSVQIDQMQGTEVTADANGFFAGDVPFGGDQRLVAAVSESGTVVIDSGLQSLAFPGSDASASRRILYDAFFGQPAVRPTPVLPAAGSWSGPLEVGTGWQGFIKVFAADDGVIYGVQPDGTLLWYLHNGYADGSFNWSGPTDVGTSWDSPVTEFTSDNGVMYAITQAGALWWYRHDGRYDGSANWTGVYPVIGDGWNQFRSVFAGDGGAIYAVTHNGDLLWYQHQNYLDGTSDFVGPVQVGFGGWAEFQWLFAGEGGVIYGIYPDGRLFRYVHFGYLDGSADWAERQEIGTGWQDFINVFAGEGGVIYAIRQDGVLLWYRYEG